MKQRQVHPMNTYVPDYYMDFKCIADRCRHSCCIGWEIDIDEDTYNLYKNTGGDFGDKLRSSISLDGDAHFCLTENERCPFLNKDNLCDIIIHLGENYLCQICDDHPRFRNFFSDREEMGLGLCCEAVAELIIGREKKTEFILHTGSGEIYDKEEAAFFAERDEVYNILQNRNIPVNKRIKKLCGKYKIELPDKSIPQWADEFRALERLDSKWDEYLDKLIHIPSAVYKDWAYEEWETAREQLLVYFVYRHMADGFYENNIRERLAFAIVSDMMITSLCIATKNDMADIARRYSSEIEYSEDNLNSLLDILAQDYNY